MPDTFAAVFIVIPPGGDDSKIMCPYALLVDPCPLSGAKQLDLVARWMKPPAGTDAILWTQALEKFHQVLVNPVTPREFELLALGDFSKQLPPGFSAPPEPQASTSGRKDSAAILTDKVAELKYELRKLVRQHHTAMAEGHFDEEYQKLFTYVDRGFNKLKWLNEKLQEALAKRAKGEGIAAPPARSEKSIALARHIDAVHSWGLPQIRVKSNMM
jgi:hypothetical protein